MIARWFVLPAVLLVAACEKPESANPGKQAANPGKTGGSAWAGDAGEEGRGETEENTRTRAEPRPPDKKHPRPDAPYEVAKAVEGQPGFVKSPYSDRIVDVRNIPSGTLVVDPSEPPEKKAYFRVP